MNPPTETAGSTCLSTLTRALPIVAAAYGRQFGVQVTLKGQQAYTDGQSIVLPTLSETAADAQAIAWGYLAHEAAHIRYTDFSVFRETGDQPLRKAILNILEDVRIEQALSRVFPGTAKRIAQVLQHLLSEGQLILPDQPHPAAVLQHWLLCHARTTVLQQTELQAQADQAAIQLSRCIPTDTFNALRTLVGQCHTLDSTLSARKLTDQILSLFKPASPSSSPSDIPLSCEPPAEDTPVITQAADMTELLRARDGDLQPDTFAQAASLLSASARDCSAEDTMTSELADTEPALPQPGMALQQAQQASVRLRRRLQGLVQATRMDRSHCRYRGQRPDARRLAGIVTGETRLFRQATSRTTPNCAVHLLVDCSGSMKRAYQGRSYSDIANECALALALALSGIRGVSVAVSYFPGRTAGVATALRPGESVQQKSACFHQPPRGTTPLAEALWFVASDLLQQPQRRKLVIVLTDGQPNHPARSGRVIQQMSNSGFDVIGIGILTDAVERLFPHACVVRDIDTLQTAVFEQTRRALQATALGL